jgi:hypothetical protein
MIVAFETFETEILLPIALAVRVGPRSVGPRITELPEPKLEP